jgi:DNA-binding ferritin-like protein (Dps family)
MNTERKNQLSELGYNTTKEYFIKTLYEKKKILLPLYKELLEILNKINRYLFCNNFEMLKNSILQYFSEFKNRAQNLDEVLLKETDNFITDLLKDEKRDYFGLKKSIKNKKIHQKSLNILVNKTQFYINDFIEYIDFIDKKYSSSNKI